MLLLIACSFGIDCIFLLNSAVSLDCIFIYHSRVLFCDHLSYGNKGAKVYQYAQSSEKIYSWFVYQCNGLVHSDCLKAEDGLERNLPPSEDTVGLLVQETSLLSSRYGLPPHSISIECFSGLLSCLYLCSNWDRFSHKVLWFILSQAYLAFFVIDDLQMDQSAKALVIYSRRSF